MIGVASGIVADGAADIFRDLRKVADQVVDGFGCEVGMAGQRGIHVVDVCLVVFIVMQVHGFRIDERLKGRVIVRQWCEFVSHRGILLRSDCTV